MADYIYLLQNRLTPAQRNAVEAVREAARAHSMPVFLVGGAARDLTSGTPVRDLDFAVQGEVGILLDEITAHGATVVGVHPVLGSTYMLFRGGVRAELGPTQTVAYPKPNQPEPHPAAILDDLRRRDFTADSMAISLNEGSYGLLLDPLNGVADIENRELRLVSNYGFIEQPALALRAARLTSRLGWTLEERTQARYETAKEEGYFRTLGPYDQGYELEEIFFEEDPLGALEHLIEEGFGDVLPKSWTSAKADRDAIEKVRDLMGQMEQMGIHIDPSPVLFPLLTAKLSAAEVEDLKSRFAHPGFVEQIDGLDAKSKELAAQISARGASAPSDTWKILFAAEPEVVLWLAYSSRSGAVQAKFKAFLNEWPQMRQRLPYALMQEMRITPDLPGYDQLLEDLFFALIDGKLDTADATRAFLEPYSPPAPVVQASPRRRPAKATRSRSKKAVGRAAEVSDGDDGEVSSDAEAATATPAVPAGEQANPPVESTPVAKKAALPSRKVAPVAAAAPEPKPGTSTPTAAIEFAADPAVVPGEAASGRAVSAKKSPAAPALAEKAASSVRSTKPTATGVAKGNEISAPGGLKAAFPTPEKPAAKASTKVADVSKTASRLVSKPATPAKKTAAKKPEQLAKAVKAPAPPAKKQAAKIVLAKSVPTKAAPGKAVLAKAVSVKSVSAKTSAAKAVPVKTVPVSIGPAKGAKLPVKATAKTTAKVGAKKPALPPRKAVPTKAAKSAVAPKKTTKTAVKVASKGRR